MDRRKVLIAIVFLALISTISAQDFIEKIEEFVEEHPYKLTGSFELGYLASVSHKIQFGEDNGTYFDYVADGGQDVLFSFSRLSLDLNLGQKHCLTFLYQPIEIETREVSKEELVIDTTHFPSGTPMRFLYSFPFWRVSYLYDFAELSDDELAIGFSLQIRDATIEFASEDGELLVSKRNIGPVPILKFRAKKYYENGFWIGTEMDGFYAPISYLNGSDSEVVGAILDASFRAGLNLPKNTEAFINLRYIGGGAVGANEKDDEPGDGYTKNWLNFMTLSIGLSHTLL